MLTPSELSSFYVFDVGGEGGITTYQWASPDIFGEMGCVAVQICVDRWSSEECSEEGQISSFLSKYVVYWLMFSGRVVWDSGWKAVNKDKKYKSSMTNLWYAANNTVQHDVPITTVTEQIWLMEFNPIKQSLAFMVENWWAIDIESIKIQVNLSNLDGPWIDVQAIHLQAIQDKNIKCRQLIFGKAKENMWKVQVTILETKRHRNNPWIINRVTSLPDYRHINFWRYNVDEYAQIHG